MRLVKKRSIIGALAAVLCFATVVCAEVYMEALRQLLTAPAPVISAPIAAGDSLTVDTPLRPRLTHNDPKILVSPSFSASGASAVFVVYLYQRTSGVDSYACTTLRQTIVASTDVQNAAARFLCNDFLIAPTLGCQVYDVRLVSITAGNVTWQSWTAGPGTTSSPATNE